MVTFLFKLGAAPFHQWVPDLYDGVPTPITTWMTHIPKIAVLLFQISIYPMGIQTNLEPLLLLAGLLSMIIGSIGLGGQYRIKRFLAIVPFLIQDFRFQLSILCNQIAICIIYLFMV